MLKCATNKLLPTASSPDVGWHATILLVVSCANAWLFSIQRTIGRHRDLPATFLDINRIVADLARTVRPSMFRAAIEDEFDIRVWAGVQLPKSSGDAVRVKSPARCDLSGDGHGAQPQSSLSKLGSTCMNKSS